MKRELEVNAGGRAVGRAAAGVGVRQAGLDVAGDQGWARLLRGKVEVLLREALGARRRLAWARGSAKGGRQIWQ